jgi:hypothetical protein
VTYHQIDRHRYMEVLTNASRNGRLRRDDRHLVQSLGRKFIDLSSARAWTLMFFVADRRQIAIVSSRSAASP